VFSNTFVFNPPAARLRENSSNVIDKQKATERREVFSREGRDDSNFRQEVYYGKPKFFDLEAMLRDQNVKIYPEDEITVFPPPFFGLGSRITIYRAPVVSLTEGQKTMVYRTKQKSVADFLKEKNIVLGEDDILTPAPGQKIQDGLKITIVRVSETTISEKIPLDFMVIKQDDPNLDKGKTKVIQKGQTGLKERRYWVRRENGKETQKKLISEEIIQAPQNEILAVGIRPIISVPCRYNNIVIEAAMRYDVNPNEICTLMMRESNGNKTSLNPAGPYYGLFQYSAGFWEMVSRKSGNQGDIFDPRLQILNTAWAFANGYRYRWP